MPPRIPIINMFGPSPVQPLEVHIDKVHACTKTLVPFFEAVLLSNWEEAKNQYQRIAKLEGEADTLKKDLRLHLHKDLFLPVPRSELLSMLMLQDRIANKAKDIAGLVISREMSIPISLQAEYMQLLHRCVDASEQARKAINELDELLEAGFRGNEVKVVEHMLDELDNIERDTDQQQIKLRRKLFDLEKELAPIDCIFLYKVIEWTGALADRAHTLGGQLQILLAH